MCPAGRDLVDADEIRRREHENLAHHCPDAAHFMKRIKRRPVTPSMTSSKRSRINC
jgi:hypothetical protein